MSYHESRTRSVLDNLFGAGFIAFMLVARPLLKGWMARWGATEEECRRALPGDERVPRPVVESTRVVTIHAPAAEVWAWLAQIGQERGGLYSYELLENLARCQIHNADRVHPEWHLQVGDRVRLGPKGYPVHKVVAMEPGYWMVLAGADIKTEEVVEIAEPPPPTFTNYVWSMVVEPVDDRNSRLIFRNRLDYRPRSFPLWLMWEGITEPIGFVMMRRMLLGIRDRAEAAYRAAPARA